jgi:hypothetical protein
MLLLLHPVLYLPFLEQQTKAKQIENEGLSITINDFNNSANQDMLCDSQLINAETLLICTLTYNIRKHWCKNSFECNNSMR